MMELKGTAPEHICAFLARSHVGTVEMINSRGIYLELAKARILLCGAQYGTVPNGVCLENWAQLPLLLQQGQPVRTGRGLLRFPSGKLRLQLQSVAPDTVCCLPPQQGMEQALELLAGLPDKGLAPLVRPLFGLPGNLDLRCETALPHVEGLLNALHTSDTASITRYVKALLGFGLGLTPSGDDVLAGLMYGLRHSPLRTCVPVATLTEAIQTNAPQRTNAISADYLLALCRDAAFTRLSEAWRDPGSCAGALLEIGSSSGSEMLLGLTLAYKMISSQSC